MNDEFKKSKINNETRYTLESMTAGATGSSSVATATGSLGKVQKRGNILAQEKKETPKPRNFVAKNAKMGGAGQHKDKKKAVKQGDVKHKKPLAESSYAEDLAKQVFDANPNIKDENAVLDAAWPIAVKDLGNKRAMSVFNYDQDFPSDLVSVYGWLQKDQQGMAEGADDKFSVYDKVEELVNQYKLFDKRGWTDLFSRLAGRKLEVAEIRREMEYASKFLQLLDSIRMRSDYRGQQDPKEDQELIDLSNQWLSLFNKATGEFKGMSSQGVAEQGYGNHPSQRVDPRTGKKYVPPKSPLGQGVAEGFNGEYDDEAGMAHTNLLTSARAVMGLLKTIDDKDNLPEWVQEKIAKAEMMLVGVWDYLQSQKEQGIDPQQDMEEASSYHNNRTGFSRGPRDDERHDLDPSDWYIVKDGKMYKTSVYPRQEQEALSRGYSRTREEASAKAEQQGVAEVAPPGWEKTVKAMKKHDNIDNPFALAWSMKNKGYKSHKKESADPYFESLASKLDDLKKKK
jgi:hypothetical protein